MAIATCRAYVPRCYSLKNSVNTVPHPPPSSLRRTAKFPYVSGTRAIPPLNGDQIDRGSRYKNLFEAKWYALCIRILRKRKKKKKFIRSKRYFYKYTRSPRPLFFYDIRETRWSEFDIGVEKVRSSRVKFPRTIYSISK